MVAVAETGAGIKTGLGEATKEGFSLTVILPSNDCAKGRPVHRKKREKVCFFQTFDETDTLFIFYKNLVYKNVKA